MTGHLTDEQMTRYLSGEEHARVHDHLQACELCRAQAGRLLHMVGSARAHAEDSSDRPANFWVLQRNEVRYALAIRRPTHPAWAIVSAMAALVFFSTLLFQTQQPRPQPEPPPQVQALSDDALLSAVNSTLEQDVPSALVPVQRLAYEREQAEQMRHNSVQ